MIDHGSRKDEGTSHRKVCKISHERCGRPLKKKLDENLDHLRQNTGDRPQIEGADQNRDLAEIDLIEHRCEKQRDLKEHQDTGQR